MRDAAGAILLRVRDLEQPELTLLRRVRSAAGAQRYRHLVVLGARFDCYVDSTGAPHLDHDGGPEYRSGC